MYANENHTPLDLAAFEREGIDPTTREPRKQPTTCPWCPPTLRATVMNRSGLCDRHELAEDRLLDAIVITRVRA